MAWNRLIENIESQIKLNGVGSITGQVLQNVLLDMIAELSSAGSAFGGMVTPEGTYNFNEESKFFVSSFMGYGLYHQFVKTKEEIMKLFPFVFNDKA